MEYYKINFKKDKAPHEVGYRDRDRDRQMQILQIDIIMTDLYCTAETNTIL